MEDHAEWDRTIKIGERLKTLPFYEEPSRESPTGKWQGRDIIGRDRPINRGVYLGGREREAIVVDDQKQQALNDVYQDFLSRRQAKEAQGIPFKQGVLDEAYNLTREVMPYSDTAVSELTRGLKPDQKVALESFIGKGGVCRHQALLCAYLLERLAKEGKVAGHVSIDRNFVPGRGGHAWVRYTNSAGEVFIIDPAQQFIGKIEQTGKNAWFYERPKPQQTKGTLGGKLVDSLKQMIGRKSSKG